MEDFNLKIPFCFWHLRTLFAAELYRCTQVNTIKENIPKLLAIASHLIPHGWICTDRFFGEEEITSEREGEGETERVRNFCANSWWRWHQFANIFYFIPHWLHAVDLLLPASRMPVPHKCIGCFRFYFILCCVSRSLPFHLFFGDLWVTFELLWYVFCTRCLFLEPNTATKYQT